VTGLWYLVFDPVVIKVTDGGEGECLSGQINLIKGFTSTQTITLTIEGVSGGDGYISAAWNVCTSGGVGYWVPAFGDLVTS
jgi:hypothetical protein